MPQLQLGRAGEAIRGGILNFLEGGAPIRRGLAGLLQGDVEPLKQAVGYGQPFPQLTPEQMRQQAFDVALDINNPMQNVGGLLGIIKPNKKISEVLDSLNPTGGLYVDYTPQIRATQPIGKNLVSIDKTMGGSPDDIITIYRGAPKKQKKIVAGDFVTDMRELAQSYTGDGNVLQLKVRKGDILDDINESLGNEYIYRPNVDKYKYD
jgi:hypothetical protein